ncbi:MAG: hypothetical protein HC802_03550 [Caldilineaceae bacterium]|nr:hypothetical protein [Caldilineaceae bacterium]
MYSHRVILLGLLTLMMALWVAGCQPMPAQPATSAHSYEAVGVTPNAAFKLHLGQEAVIDQSAMHLLFAAVEEDARCPSQVTCNEDGPALIRVDVTLKDGSVRQLILDANSSNPANAIEMIEEYSLRAARLTPLAELPESPIPTQEYVATLVIRNEK